MRRFAQRPRHPAISLRAAGLLAALGVAASCHGVDMTHQQAPPATLGQDLYGVMCDRIGASSLREDLSGASYHAVCHPTASGAYADQVDVSALPAPVTDEAKRARALAVAKVEAIGRRRADLIAAFDAIVPDIEIEDASTEVDGDTVRLHDALLSFAQSIVPLYESDPYDPAGEPLAPSVTRAIGRLAEDLVASQEAREALSRITGREGYRPAHLATGSAGPVLTYPSLRSFASAVGSALVPGREPAPGLTALLSGLRYELAAIAPRTLAPAVFVVDPVTDQPNRPRSTGELLAAALLSVDPAFAEDPGASPRYIVMRDHRGFAVPAGNARGVPGTVSAPFVDKDGDGRADVDRFGRFVGEGGEPLNVPPFSAPGGGSGVVDEYGRPSPLVYQYLDTSRTALSFLLQNLGAVADAAEVAPPGDPDAWKVERETLMYLLAGARVALGDREPAMYDEDEGAIRPESEPCPGCIPYLRFRGEDSPVADLVHAVGQILADKDSDALLLSLLELVEEHPDLTARLVGAALRVRTIALEHDERAAKGLERAAAVPYETPIWDEVAEVMARVTSHPGLVKDLLAALASPRIVTPAGGASHLGEMLAVLTQMRDALSYNPTDLGGSPINQTDPPQPMPHVPVDRAAPILGSNRSILQRLLQLIHDTSGVKACNKKDANIVMNSEALSGTWPIGSAYKECELFEIKDLAAFFVDSMLPEGHPKRARFRLKDTTLNAVLEEIPPESVDQIFEESSGIPGLTLWPSSQALSRLVFFGASSAEHAALPDLDPLLGGANATTNTFISTLMDPAATALCPKEEPSGVRRCVKPEQLLRLRDPGTIFALETYGFYFYMEPLIATLAGASCSEDLSACAQDEDGDFTTEGERIFVDLIDIFHRHWPGPDHGAECATSGSAGTNPLYCSGAGVNTYEPVLVDAFKSDLIPALHAFAEAAADAWSVTVRRGPSSGDVWTGGEVIERLARILFDPAYAAAVGMVDRRGVAQTTWTDGTPKPQLTTFDLLANALHGIDAQFNDACRCEGLEGDELSTCQGAYDACRADVERRRGQWKRARSQWTDLLLAVEGEGTAARWKSPGAPRALVAALRVLREQLNARCPDRETGEVCVWAKEELGKKTAEMISGPVVAGVMDVMEALRADEGARREAERMLAYLFDPGGAAFEATLSAGADALQVLAADREVETIVKAVAGVVGPSGAAEAGLKLLRAMSSDEYDRYRVTKHVLPNLVKPMKGGAGPAPLEVILDAIAEVNRIDAASSAPLEPADYEAVFRALRDFTLSETRGLEQIYEILRARDRE